MGFFGNVKHCFRNAFNFKGRASKPEFWRFFWFMALGLIAMVVINSVLFGPSITAHYATDAAGQPVGDPIRFSKSYSDGVLGDIFLLICLVPWLAVTLRRMHDWNKPGYWPFLPWLLWVVSIFVSLMLVMGPGAFWADLAEDGNVQSNNAAAAVVILLLFLVCVSINIYWLTRPSSAGSNRFGPGPLTETNGEIEEVFK